MNRFIAKATSQFTYAILDNKEYEHMYIQLLEANLNTMADDIIPVLDVYEGYTCGDLIERIQNLSKAFEDVYRKNFNNGANEAATEILNNN